MSHQSVPLFVRSRPCEEAIEQMGTATSKKRPTSIPKKLAGVTPTISTGWRFRLILLPSALAWPPN